MDSAVMVIDMQNGFVHERGSLRSIGTALPGIDGVIGETQELLADARGAGLPVVYTRHQWRRGFVDAPRSVIERFPPGTKPLEEGSWDAAICDALAPEREDVIVDKNRYDAFLYTDLDLILRALGVKRLLVTGVVTSVCVESTVRSAHMRDYSVTVASDCTAAPEGFHEPSLASMALVFATVAPWREGFGEVLGETALQDRRTA
jgi:ureidoacrylate peracid hydrolase